MTILYCILSALASWYVTSLYYKGKPKVIERHWIGYSVQERIHFENINDYISKN